MAFADKHTLSFRRKPPRLRKHISPCHGLCNPRWRLSMKGEQLSFILAQLRLNKRMVSKPPWPASGNRKTEESRKEGPGPRVPANTAPQRTVAELLRIAWRWQKRLTSVSPTASMMYQYFVKIVPTIYVKTDGEVSSDAPFIVCCFFHSQHIFRSNS